MTFHTVKVEADRLERARLISLLEDAAASDSGRPVVYTMIRHASRSGDTFDLSFFIIVNGDMVNITRMFATATGYARFGHSVTTAGTYPVIRVRGIGMDVSNYAVMMISKDLFGNNLHLDYRKI